MRQVIMDKIKKKSFREGHRSIILAGAMIFIGLFLMNFASAELFQFDNVKQYDVQTQTVKIVNTFGIGQDIAEIKLNTPIHYGVGYGDVQKVAEFEVTNYEDYTNAINNMKFTNLNNGKSIDRNFEYKVLSYETIVVNDYGDKCKDNLKEVKYCEKEIIGKHEEQREVWSKLDKTDFLKGETYTIGIFTYVEKGDNVEWIMDAYGKSLTEWATWTASLNVNLVSYYKFDEGTGTTPQDSFGTNHGVFFNTPVWSAGKIGNGLNISLNNAVNLTSDINLGGTSNSITISAWINTNCDNDHETVYGRESNSVEHGFNFATMSDCSLGFWGNDGVGWSYSNSSFNQNEWNLIVVSINNGEGIFYINGAEAGTFSENWTNEVSAKGVFGYNNYYGTSTDIYTGEIDEIGIWKRSLTSNEVTDIYNSGSGLSFPYPSNISIQKVEFYVDGILEETNNSGIGGNYYFSKFLTDGSYNWYLKAYSNNGATGQSATRYLNIDTNYPTISETGIADLYSSTSPLSLTWNLYSADLNPDSCWYYTSDDPTNVSVVCNSSTITNFTVTGSKTITYCANDTSNHESCASSNLFVGYYPYVHNSDKTSVGEGNPVVLTLYVNGTNINSQWSETNATLDFNGTSYAPDTIDRSNANYVKFIKTVIVTGGNPTGMNYPFNWTYNIKNSTATVLTQSTDTKNIAIYSITLTDGTTSCSGRVILNMSLRNEELNTRINQSVHSTNVQLDLTISSRSNTSLTWNFSKTWIDSSNDTVSVCIPSATLTSSSYRIDFTIGYKATGFVQEFYYMDNGTLDNTGYFNSYTNSNISLMDLESGDSTTFLFKFKDQNNLQVDDAIIHVFRKYIGEGLFREVERASEYNNGETHVHLVGEDVIYYFMVTQYGHIIYTSSQYNAKCLSTPCQIELTASASFVEFPTNYDQTNGTSYSLTSDKSSRLVTLTFVSNASKTVNLSLFKYYNGVISYVNTTSLTGTSGVITLHVPSSSGNQTFFASIFTDGSFVRSEWIDLKEKAQDYFGTTGAILGGLIVLAMIFMAISEGVVLIIIGCLAIFIIGAMQLVDLSWLAIISIICAGALIIWKLTSGGKQ
jgi:hypothetical protein